MKPKVPSIRNIPTNTLRPASCMPGGAVRSSLGVQVIRAAVCVPFLMLLAVVWALVPTTSAYAYVDPSVMTYTIQAVAGVAVAVSAVIGVAFRRTRRKLYQVFNIDENAHKIVEDGLVRFEEDDPEYEENLAHASEVAVQRAEASDEQLKAAPRAMRRRTRFAFALIICVFAAFTIFIAPALEIWGGNSDSLVFSLMSVWWIPVVFCLAIAVALAAALTLLKPRPFYTAFFAIFAVAIAAYVQSMFLNHGMMPADGGFIGWTDWYFIKKMIFSGIVWAIIIAGIIVLSKRRSHTWLKAVSAVACALIVVQLVGVGSVAMTASENAIANQDKPYVTQGDLLSVSPRNNVIVFVLDSYDTFLLEEVREQDPGFLDDFEDFTYFRNSLGTMIPTPNAIPNMLSGRKPQPDQTVAEYRAERYEKSTFLKDIHDLGFSMGLYTDSLMMDYNNPAEMSLVELTTNVHPVGRAPIDIGRAFIAMEQCALYREAPWVMKPLFWYYTSDVNNRMIASGGIDEMDESLYELDDAAILKKMRVRGLHATDESPGGAFRFIHLFGPHFPYSVDENGNDVGTNRSDRHAQAKGSMKVVTEYMNQMKSLGVYDDATIIVTADHGIWFLSDDPVSQPISPIMLVKPAHTSEDGAPVQRSAWELSEMPVSHDDFQATVIAAMNGDAEKYGKTFFQIDDPDRVRYFDAQTNAGGGQRFVEYAVTGDVSNLDNWAKTGNEWPNAW